MRPFKKILFMLYIWSLPLGYVYGSQTVVSKAIQCQACHGERGVSLNPMWPNLAGQKKDYLIKQLTDFKEDRRIDPLMSGMAKTLSAADIENLANYFENLK